jgi:hypothetical protein
MQEVPDCGGGVLRFVPRGLALQRETCCTVSVQSTTALPSETTFARVRNALRPAWHSNFRDQPRPRIHDMPLATAHKTSRAANCKRLPGLPLDLSSVIAKEFVDFFHGEFIELHNLGMRPVRSRHYSSGLFLVVYFRNEPCFVIPVLAPPVCMREEMGTAFEEDLNGVGARHDFFLVWNFNQKSRHSVSPPFLDRLPIAWLAL